MKRRLEKLERRVAISESSIAVIPDDPVEFSTEILGFKPTFYQEKLLRDQSKRIVVRMARQSGKTATIAVKAVWFASTHPRTLTLIVSPSLRQSMIMMDRVQGYISSIPQDTRRRLIQKMQRTVVRFRNGSMIVALPCSIHLLRGYTAHLILVDEGAFIRDDETLYYSILYPMLSTTDGTLIVSSTPWSRNSVFYRLCGDPGYSKHVVTWRDVVEAGLVKPEFIEEMRKLLPRERFIREFEAEFAEDESCYFPQDLIARCIDPDLEYYDFESYPQGLFYGGVDLGKYRDYSAVAVVEAKDDRLLAAHIYRFPLESSYASVVGYVKTLCERWDSIVSVAADQTGVGEYVVEDMVNAGIPVEGVTLTSQRKEEILGYMKQLMTEGNLSIPYDPELITEINIEKYNLTKDGHITFFHDENTHDDLLWALALSVYASRSRTAYVSKTKGILHAKGALHNHLAGEG